MSIQWKRQVGVAGFACAAALAVAGCNTTNENMVSGSSGQGAVVGGVTAVGSGVASGVQTVGSGVVGGVQAVGSGVVSGVQTVGSAVVSPFLPSSYNNWGYTDSNGVYHRYDRHGYYDASGAYIPYDNVRGAYCAKWDPISNECIWWLTG